MARVVCAKHLLWLKLVGGHRPATTMLSVLTLGRPQPGYRGMYGEIPIPTTLAQVGASG